MSDPQNTKAEIKPEDPTAVKATEASTATDTKATVPTHPKDTAEEKKAPTETETKVTAPAASTEAVSEEKKAPTETSTVTTEAKSFTPAKDAISTAEAALTELKKNLPAELLQADKIKVAAKGWLLRGLDGVLKVAETAREHLSTPEEEKKEKTDPQNKLKK